MIEVGSTASTMRRLALLAATVAGLFAFCYPFLLPALVDAGAGEPGARAAEAPLLLAAVVACAGASVVSIAGSSRPGNGRSSRTAALLASLGALDAMLRLVPSIGGASLVFAPIILSGAVFGAEFGFLMGALSLALSAVLTGGLGPWLPYQVLVAGWIGASAGLVRWPVSARARVVALAVFACGWGFLFGALMNLYNWPFIAPGGIDAGLYWSPDSGAADNLVRYGRFYVVTSLTHDAMRAAANAGLILAVGTPLLIALERARLREGWASLDRPGDVTLDRAPGA